MDYVIGFALGYFCNKLFNFLSKLSQYDYDNRLTYKEDWDFISLREDDLP